MTRENIVLVEDDADLSATLSLALEREGYEVVSYPTGREGLVGILGDPPDLVLLDLNLPDLDGLSVCRECGTPLPCAISPSSCSPLGSRRATVCSGSISAPTTTSPSHFRCANSKAGSGRFCAVAALMVVCPRTNTTTIGLTVRRGPMDVEFDGAFVRLTVREFELLWYLITTRPRVASRESILERVWGLSSDVETRTVDVHIRALRAKLGSEMVETVIGAGYRFRGFR